MILVYIYICARVCVCVSVYVYVWVCVYVRRVCPQIAKAAVRQSIQAREECQSIDPAPIHWEKGKLGVNGNWLRLGMDITLYGAHHFLTQPDCGPSRFSVWKHLARQDSSTVIHQLETVFFERGPPHELPTDNEPAICSREFRAFARDLGVNWLFHCVYAQTWNRIAERCHRTVERITARMHCPIQEAVYWHNVTPKDSESPQTAPAYRIRRYELRVKGIDATTTTRVGLF